MPLAFQTDREVLDAAFRTIGIWTPNRVRVAWISNTKDLEWLAVSGALLESVGGSAGGGELFDLPYNTAGNLTKLRDFLQRRWKQI